MAGLLFKNSRGRYTIYVIVHVQTDIRPRTHTYARKCMLNARETSRKRDKDL